MKSLSQLSVLKKISISFSFGNNQFPPQLPRIFEELSVVESLRELELKFPFAFYESADSSISKLVDMGRLTTLKAEGTGVGRKLINSIAKCRSLISLTVAVTLMDFCCLLSSNRLPPLLCFHIVNSFFDRELPEEICFNFEGVKRFVVNCDFALPSEIHHEIKRSATDSVTLTEFGMRIWNIFDVRLSSTLSCVIPSLLNLEELSISTNYCEGEESTLFLISLHSNTRLKRLNLEAYVEQTKVFECLNRLLEISSCLEAVTITMESFPIFSLARMIRSIANNPSSVLKSLLFMCQSKFELRFWNNGGRRKLPMFVLHDSPPLNRKCDSVREIFKIIDRWDVDSDEIVVDTLVFDNLTHVEMQGLLKFLMIKEMSERNSRVKAGYLDGSICVWYDHDRS
ncbi:hypothetical protein HK098_007897 [Nowakowskiella sp. JEL0407]|nr:hypothetical protein HK098_007897 [Nowakowskiella sp. JEL0407]